MDTVKILNGSRLALKSIIILVMVVLLLLPMAKINSLIDERMQTQKGVKEEFEQKWGAPQTVSGPILRVPYIDSNTVDPTYEYAYVSPEKVIFNGDVNPQMKKRGIYEMPVYATDLEVSGNFNLAEIKNHFKQNSLEPKWRECVLLSKMSDYTRLNNVVTCQLNDQKTTLKTKYQSEADDKGYLLEAFLPLQAQNEVSFSYNLEFNGIQQLEFNPKGNQVEVAIKGEWEDPSFTGDRLTSSNAVNNGVFKANWKYLNLSTKGFKTNPIFDTTDAFGVNLLVANNHYSKANRSAKYAILLIGLTYVAFFFIELLNGKNMHPLQYALVGLALCLFYSLLVAFSEHIAFNWAYLTSMTMTLLLVAWYTRMVFDSTKISMLMALMQGVVYGFIFLIIQIQEFALLAGSVGLFAILAVLMYCSKKIDFNQNQSTQETV